MKSTLSTVSLLLALVSSPVLADCLGPSAMSGRNLCNPQKNRQNSFDESNVSNSRMSDADIARDREKDRRRFIEETKQRRQIEIQQAAEAEAINRERARAQEAAYRQQQISAMNRQTAALEAAAAAAEAAARNSAIAEQQPAQRRPQAPAPRPMHCNPVNGWCD